MRIFLLIFISLLLTASSFGQNGTYSGLKLKATLGLIPEWKESRKFGFNPDVDTGTVPEEVWSAGGEYPFPTAAATTTIVSSNAADDAGSTGCYQVSVNGLDANYADTTETVILDGTNAVTLSTQFFRINRASCILSGSGQTNAGNIDIKHGATIIGQLPIGASQTQQVVYTVPAGFNWLLDRFSATALKKQAASATIVLQIKIYGTNTWRTILTAGLISVGSSFTKLDRPEDRPFVIPEKSDVRVRVTYTDTTDLEVNTNMSGFLVAIDNPYL